VVWPRTVDGAGNVAAAVVLITLAQSAQVGVVLAVDVTLGDHVAGEGKKDNGSVVL